MLIYSPKFSNHTILISLKSSPSLKITRIPPNHRILAFFIIYNYFTIRKLKDNYFIIKKIKNNAYIRHQPNMSFYTSHHITLVSTKPIKKIKTLQYNNHQKTLTLPMVNTVIRPIDHFLYFLN